MSKIVSVSGELPPEELGITLPHEHLVHDIGSVWSNDERFTREYSENASVITQKRLHTDVSVKNLWWMRGFPTPNGVSLDNYRLANIDLVVNEARDFRDRGGRTIVDVTCFRLGRDPQALQTIARRTGLNIVVGTGYYFKASYPSDMDQKTDEEIGNEIIEDITKGIDGTQIRAGIIGEVGASHGFGEHENEKKSFRGSAIAQQETGAPITIHPPYFYQEAHEVLDVLEDAGAHLDNVIMGHMDGTIRSKNAIEYHSSIADRGVFLQFDGFGKTGYRPMMDKSWPLDETRVEHIRELFDRGYGDQILISQDIFKKTELKYFGGLGYDYIVRDILSLFRKRGFSESEINDLLVNNTAEAITFK